MTKNYIQQFRNLPDFYNTVKADSDSDFAFRTSVECEDSTLYASVFAVMCFHYCGTLESLPLEEKLRWADYINSYQNDVSGLYESPEIFDGIGEYHTVEHRSLHLTCHVLPALSLLGFKPKYEVKYIEKYFNTDYLKAWLSKVDLSMAWVEGNNLLFIGQLLTYSIKKNGKGYEALDVLFVWLEETVDPATGLWGTDHGCDLHKAMYGAYHQLILFFYWRRPVPHIEKLIDSTLRCQHFDGGFSEWRGGGTCQDIDGIDILAKAYFLIDYRRRDVRKAMRGCLHHVFNDRLASSTGFLDRRGYSFIHNSMPATETALQVPNAFSTWFTAHAIVDIAEVLSNDTPLQNIAKNYNNVCSMGWGGVEHDQVSYGRWEQYRDRLTILLKVPIIFLYDFLNKVRG